MWEIKIRPGSVGIAAMRDGKKHRTAIGRGDADNAGHFARKAIDLCAEVITKQQAKAFEHAFRKAFDDGEGPTAAEIREENERQREQNEREQQEAEQRRQQEFDAAVAAAVRRLDLSGV